MSGWCLRSVAHFRRYACQSPPSGCRTLVPGNPGNSGGKPGRSGRRAYKVRRKFERMASNPKMHATLAAIAQDPTSRHCIRAAEVILDRAFGKPEQRQRHLGPGDNSIVVVFQDESECSGSA